MADDTALAAPAASSAPSASSASSASSAPAASAALVADSSASSASSQVEAGMPETIGAGSVAGLVTTALALAFVLGLAWVLLRLLKRFQQRGTGGAAQADAPQVLRSTGLGARERLVTVRWKERDYLLGVTPTSVNLIDHHPFDRRVIDDEPAAPRPD